MNYYYDLHIHSCLSPCGDDDATPDSILGMGELNGLDVMALTDHNTAKNCPAFFEAAARHGIIPLGGMELTTAEDIHMVCLFDRLENAMAFDEYIGTRRVLIQNRVDIFGNQLIVDSEDNITGTEEHLLSNATTVSLEEAPTAVSQYGGVCFPAHIDRQANGLLAVLGFFPERPVFPVAEVHDAEQAAEYEKRYGKRIVTSSDAHYLWDIAERRNALSLDCERQDAAKEIIHLLRGGV